MKYLRCNDGKRQGLSQKSTALYCSGKLPCGRCIASEPCNHTLDEFDCDNCRYKFICLTMAWGCDDGWNRNWEFVKLTEKIRQGKWTL